MSARRLGLSVVSVVCVSVALLVWGGAQALAAMEYAPGIVFGGPCTGSPCGDGQFSEPTGVAANDTTHDVYVVDKGNNRVEYFTSMGTYVGQFDGSATPSKAFVEPEAIAIDDSGKTPVEDPAVGNVYVGSSSQNVVDEFSSTGKYEGQLVGRCEALGEAQPCAGSKLIPFEGIGGVAVNGQGDVWVLEYGGGRVDEFNDEGVYVGGFEDGYGHAHAITAEPNGSLVVARGESAAGPSGVVEVWSEAAGVWSARQFTGTSIESTALVASQSNGNILIDQGSDIEFWSLSGSLEQTFPGEGFAGSHGVAMSTAGTAYASQGVADDVQSFNYVLFPGVANESGSQVTETTELLRGTVNPEGEVVTECSFEYAIYGTPAGVYPSKVPCKQAPTAIGAGTQAVTVSTEVTNLRPGATYHYRLAAANGNGIFHGVDKTFIVGALATPLSLPDNRAYELVSEIGVEVSPPAAGEPSATGAEEFGEYPAPAGHYRAAANGGSIAYDGQFPPSGVGGYNIGSGGNNLYFAERRASGWQSGNIDPVSSLRRIEGFSTDLSQQIFNIGEPGFNEAHGGPTKCGGNTGGLYSREGGVDEHSYVLMNSATTSSTDECEFATFAGISEDDAQVLIQSPGAYSPQAVPGREGSPENNDYREGYDNLYARTESGLTQINILPDGEPEQDPYAIFGGRSLTEYKVFEHNFANDVSNDGSRIFWTSLNTGDMYVRLNDTQPQSPIGHNGECTVSEDACTVQVDAGEGQCVAEGKCESGGGVFWTTGEDGLKIFFTDCRKLTSNSTAIPQGECERLEAGKVGVQSWEHGVSAGRDLYEYDLVSGRLTDLTVDRNAADVLGADVLGVIGASKDGSYVYFVANGVLAGENAEARLPMSGQPNLYVSHEGKISYIATLESSDNQFIGTDETSEKAGTVAGDWRIEPGLRSAQVAQNGQAVAFMSRLPLTGYDNYGVVSVNDKQEPTYWYEPEIFLYQVAGGRIACASCTPTGTPPIQTAEDWEGVVGGHVNMSGSTTFMSRWMNAEGTQIYFDSNQPLVARDSNHREDVYEWESDGSSGCRQSMGCVDLLSGGDAARAAFFLDASESGDDVFFTSREELLGSASGEAVKLYDARVDGGFVEPSLACTGSGCQGVPPPQPIFSTPASVTFGGVGNFSPSASGPKAKKTKPKVAKCKGGLVKKKSKCVHKRKPHNAASKHGKSSAKGRK